MEKALRRQAKSNESCLWKKHFEANGRLILRYNWSCSDCSTWTTLHGRFWVVHQHLFGEIRKTNMKRRIIVHNGNASFRTSSKTSNWWVHRRRAPTRHPMFLFICAHQENIARSTILAKHQFLFNYFFQVTLNNTNDGSTSKHSE